MTRDRTAPDGGPKLPPHNVDVEQSVLGAILSRNSLLYEACADLEPRHFFEPRLRYLFDVMAGMIREGRKADPVTLNVDLPKDLFAATGLTLPQYLARLVGGTLSLCPEHVQLHVRELERLAWKRDSQARLEDMQDLLAKGTAAEILAALHEASAAIEAAAPSAPKDDICVVDAGEDIELPPPRPWLMATQFCQTCVSSIFAPGATGKTALRFLQAISLASGRPLTGQRIFRRSRVLILCLEDDINEVRRRVMAALIHHGIDRQELNGWLFYAAPEGVKLAELDPRTGRPTIGPLNKFIRDTIKKLKIDLIIVDPLIRSHGLEENSAGMDFVIDLLCQIAIQCVVSVDVPHHTRKGALTPGDADSGRGHSSIRDGGRLVSTLNVMTEDEAKEFGIPVDERRSYIRLDDAKMNIVPAAGKAKWFRIVSLPIKNGNEMYPVGDDVQTVEVWAPPKTWEGLSNAVLNAALDEIERGVIDGDGHPIGQRYSSAGAAKERAAWKVVQKHCPDKTDAQCREIIKIWKTTGVLFEDDYNDPIQRKDVPGLYVNNSKRPGREAE
jgi:hypothetical protein